ncbi:spore germination protein [Candidatus Contubernalis alkalaceticus]|nr:spore germination protein [Candidatus Contubernalis alkalaceticus]
MLKKLLNKLIQGYRQEKKEKENSTGTAFTGDLSVDEGQVRATFQNCGDVIYRSLKIPALGNRRALLVFVDTLVNQETMNRDVIAGLIDQSHDAGQSVENVLDLISVGEANWHESLEEIKYPVMTGMVLVLLEGSNRALTLETRQWPTRSVEEPEQERVIHGPREGFNESLQINLGLIRRRLPTPSLKVEFMKVGRRTASQIALIFLEDVADSDVVEEIRDRIQAIDIDGILDPGALGELISNQGGSPFPLLLNTERPDKVVGELMQGKLALVVQGSNYAKLLPVTFADFNQSPEDYYIHPVFATLNRFMRFVSFFISTSITAVYTAVITFHYEMIPRDIVVFIAETRAGVPFVPFIEAFFLEFSIELIREASLRLPGPIGQTIGIVGALVLGQAVVNARLVSPVMLIVVAIGFMTSFTIPNYEASLPLRYLRFPLILSAAFL